MTPRVSVAMGVYNGGAGLLASMESILAQRDVSLELIVVDDGSTDDSSARVARLVEQDPRVRLLRQENSGLTAALIRGCSEAKGEFIARQDVGDRSLPGRLARQVALMDRHPEVVLTACGTRCLGPAGEHLMDRIFRDEELDANLRAAIPVGPSHHGATLFRRDAYEAVGGYRAAFLVAQDLDLWVRLAEAGGCRADPEIGYEAEWALGSISHRLRDQQERAVTAICRSRELRARGEDDSALLADFEQAVRKARSAAREAIRPAERAAYLYFIGGLLLKRDRVAARRYLGEAVRHAPGHWRAWLKLWLASLAGGRQ